VGEFCPTEGEDAEDEEDAGDEVGFLGGPLFSAAPEGGDGRWEPEGPGEEAEPEGEEVIGEGEEVAEAGFAAVALEGGDGAHDDVFAEADDGELAVGADHGWDAPDAYEGEHEDGAEEPLEGGGAFIAMEAGGGPGGHADGDPGDGAFCEETDGKEGPEGEPPWDAAIWAGEPVPAGPCGGGAGGDHGHICDGGVGVDDGLDAEAEDEGGAPASAGIVELGAPEGDDDGGEGAAKAAGEAGGEFVLAEEFVGGFLEPVDEGGFVEAEFVVEVGDDEIVALEHFAGGFGETGFVAVDQRQGPIPGSV